MARRERNINPWEMGALLSVLAAGCLGISSLLHMTNVPAAYAAARTDAKPAQVAVTEPEAHAGLMLFPQSIPTQSPSSPAEQAAWTSNAAAPIVLPERPVKTVDVKAADTKVYGGKTYRYVKTITLRVTAYAPDARCCYPYDGKTTASGLPVTTNGGKLVAADTSVIPLHYLVAVPGYAGGNSVPVLDRGGAIKGNRLDVLLPSYDKAKTWGSRMLEVKVYKPVN